jgi:predicted nucleic acid-binding protein
MNVAVLGTIGVLMRAKRKRLIARIRPELDALRVEAGFWLNDELYARVLESEGEAA